VVLPCPEKQSDQSRYKVISLLPDIQKSNIDELLRINVLLGDIAEFF